MNALTYVDATNQATAIKNISSYCKNILCLTAFHPDSIKADLLSNNFSAYLENQLEIHNAWGDRLTQKPIDPKSNDYTWRLPKTIPNLPDRDFRFTSIFVKK